MKRRTYHLPLLLTSVVLLAAWSLVAYAMRPRQEGGLLLLPGPLAVVRDLYHLLVDDRFLGDIALSSMRIGLGVLAATIPAAVFGIWFGISPRVHAVASPLFAFVKYIPPVSFVPILILWFGIGLPQQVALLFIGTFFYLAMMVAETVVDTPQAYKDAGLTLGLRERQLVWRVIIPHSMPAFFEHLRVMFGIAWTYLTVAEMVAAPNGIGRVIINSQRYLQTGRVLAGMLTIGVLGVCFDLTLLRTSRWVCRWKG
ncbi:MAG TPA: ABC transporter permease [Thermoanaerobaculia bacterium]|nr:ABC transporter permease [Thermoanaerobaculia bacterium]